MSIRDKIVSIVRGVVECGDSSCEACWRETDAIIKAFSEIIPEEKDLNQYIYGDTYGIGFNDALTELKTRLGEKV